MTTEDEPLPGSEHARDFYNEWEFAQKGVCLYTHGIAWRGAQLLGFRPDEREGEVLLDISEQALLEVVPAWFIDGKTTVAIQDGAPPSLTAATGDGLTVLTLADSFGDEDGHSLLRAACSNYLPIRTMQEVMRVNPNDMAETALKYMLQEARSGLFLPDWAYDPAQTALANMWVATAGLEQFRLQVRRYRDNLLHAILDGLRDWLAERHPDFRDPIPAWNRQWAPSEATGGWDGLYWAFRECGLELTHYGQEFPAWLRKFGDAGVPMPRWVLNGWAELGL